MAISLCDGWQLDSFSRLHYSITTATPLSDGGTMCTEGCRAGRKARACRGGHLAGCRHGALMMGERMLETVSVGFRPLEAEPLDKSKPIRPDTVQKIRIARGVARCGARSSAGAPHREIISALIPKLIACLPSPARMAIERSIRALPGKHAETNERKTKGEAHMSTPEYSARQAHRSGRAQGGAA